MSRYLGFQLTLILTAVCTGLTFLILFLCGIAHAQPKVVWSDERQAKCTSRACVDQLIKLSQGLCQKGDKIEVRFSVNPKGEQEIVKECISIPAVAPDAPTASLVVSTVHNWAADEELWVVGGCPRAPEFRPLPGGRGVYQVFCSQAERIGCVQMSIPKDTELSPTLTDHRGRPNQQGAWWLFTIPVHETACNVHTIPPKSRPVIAARTK